jgi:hypothetical protein
MYGVYHKFMVMFYNFLEGKALHLRAHCILNYFFMLNPNSVWKDSDSNPDENVAACYVVSSLSYFLHLQLVALAGRTMTVPLSHPCHLLDLPHINRRVITTSIRNQYSPWCV